MTVLGKSTTITWVGHGTFHLITPEGRGVLLDAWVDGNPACPDALKSSVRHNLAAILVTHGHFDHINDLVDLAQETGATVACQFDLVSYLVDKGIPNQQLLGFNKGGTVQLADMRVTMTNAIHSSSIIENGQLIGLGTPAGFVIRMSNGFTLYYTGDTGVTMDMQIVGDLYAPEVVMLPIGDHFTMDPRQAGYALKLIRAKYAIPCHYGTFPILTGTPEALEAAIAEFGAPTEVIALKPGESVS